MAVAAEEFLGMIHGSDMCWLGNGEPFNGQPCLRNFTEDPVRMFFANLWVRLTAYTVNASWGAPVFDAILFGTVVAAVFSFYLALREIDRGAPAGGEEPFVQSGGPPQTSRQDGNTSRIESHGEI